MRIKYHLIVLLFILSSCGGKEVKEIPGHLTAGVSEMIKGNDLYNKGCHKNALEKYFKAYRYFILSDQIKNSANTLNNIGNVYRAVGKTDTSIIFLKEAKEIYLHLKDYKEYFKTSSNLAAVYITKEDYKKAEALLLKTKAEMAEKNVSTPPVIKNLAVLYTRMNRFDEAEKMFSILQRAKEKKNISSSFHFARGNYYFKRKMYDKAIASFKKALEIDRNKGAFNALAQDLYRIAKAYEAKGEKETYLLYLKRCLGTYSVLKRKDLTSGLKKILKADSGKSHEVTDFFNRRWMEEDESVCD